MELWILPFEVYGGERGIRTPDTRKGIHAFEARAFSHSAISPRALLTFSFYQRTVRIFGLARVVGRSQSSETGGDIETDFSVHSQSGSTPAKGLM